MDMFKELGIMSWGHRHQSKKAVQSSIDTFDDTTKEDEQQNRIGDIVNNINDVEEHYSIGDTNKVEELNMEETSREKETEEEEALDVEEDPIDCAIEQHNMFVFIWEECLPDFLQ